MNSRDRHLSVFPLAEKRIPIKFAIPARRFFKIFVVEHLKFKF